MVSRILVTGAGGFIGSRLIPALLRDGHRVVAASRHGPPDVGTGSSTGSEHCKPSLQWLDLYLEDREIDLAPLVRDVDAVIHLAAHVHVAGIQRCLSGARFHRVNADGTRRLAAAAAAAGVRRFILLSSIGVNGPFSGDGDRPEPFREGDAPRPVNAYTRSKLAAEEQLRAICRSEGMEHVILRAPLVFGPGNGANFLRLMRALHAGIPLPLADTDVRRGLMYVDNLVEVIKLCLFATAAGDSLFLAADDNIEVRDLARRLAAVLGRRARFWRCPQWLIAMGRRLPLVGTALTSLNMPLMVDSSRMRDVLKWEPQVGLDEALAETGRWFLARRGVAT